MTEMNKPSRTSGPGTITPAVLEKYRRLHVLMSSITDDSAWPDDMEAMHEARRIGISG